MTYNFDTVIDRRNTPSVKWAQVKDKDGIAVAMADMDFKACKEVTDAIETIAKFGIYGYVGPGAGYYAPFIDWCKRRYGWSIQKEWISYSPGIIAGMGSAVRVFSEIGDHVIFQTPAFQLFTELVVTNGREPVHNPLIYKKGKYYIDFDDLERKAQNPKAKVLLLCNPQNPSLRVFTKEELLKIGDICLRNNVIIVSDEVHCDMVFKPHKHIPIASLSDALLQNTVTCLSPTKTFNLAGLQISVNVIANPEIRAKYQNELVSRDSKRPNLFGMVGFRAAYEHGESWLEDVSAYIKDNLDFLVEYINKNIPELSVVETEGTYLAWVDCSALGITGTELGDFFIEKANIYTYPGITFGEEGTSFVRLNLACPRSVVEETAKRMEKAIHGRV